MQVATGDLAEKELSDELLQFFKKRKVVIFWGPKLRLPGKGKGGHQEFDFVIVDLELKAVIGIESKATLHENAAKSASGQTKKLKELLEKYFGPELEAVLHSTWQRMDFEQQRGLYRRHLEHWKSVLLGQLSAKQIIKSV